MPRMLLPSFLLSFLLLCVAPDLAWGLLHARGVVSPHSHASYTRSPSPTSNAEWAGSKFDADRPAWDPAEFDRGVAPPEEIAKHLPPWAATIALDAEANAEYETACQVRRAKDFCAVEGREWSETGDEGIEAFTPIEVAEDFGIPADALLAHLATLGVEDERLRPHRPLREVCSAAQVEAVASFAHGCDAIELREEWADETLEDVAEDLGHEDGGKRLLQLCQASDIPARLGVKSQIRNDQLALLLLSVKTDGLASAPLPAVAEAHVEQPSAGGQSKRGQSKPSEDDLTEDELKELFRP